MAKFIATIKAIFTRVVFAAHGFLAIWQVTMFKNNSFYWYLSSPILLLFFEGVFTLTIKENQEWKWFCPSVFLYLSSIVPAIWLLELDKVDRRLKIKEETTTFNLSASTGANLKELNNLIGVQIKLPEIDISTETWITLIEQFLMLILIIGRWMLPKGDLTRDQLSQLLLVYIGTAADIIEFFDSFKDDKIASEPILVLLTLAIWSWSLMQFTVVLTATKARKSRLSTTKTAPASETTNCCCSIDVWGIAINIALQDAPFLVFRLLIITHFNIISYMNVFFTCKNTLVILLQLYRLYVVHSESHKNKQKKRERNFELTNISIISRSDMDSRGKGSDRNQSAIDYRKEKLRKAKLEEKRKVEKGYESGSDVTEVDDFSEQESREHKRKHHKEHKKDTGYSTASSHASHKHRKQRDESIERTQERKQKDTVKKEKRRVIAGKEKETQKPHKKTKKQVEKLSSLTDNNSDIPPEQTDENRRRKIKSSSKKPAQKYSKDTTVSLTSSSNDASTE